MVKIPTTFRIPPFSISALNIFTNAVRSTGVWKLVILYASTTGQGTSLEMQQALHEYLALSDFPSLFLRFPGFPKKRDPGLFQAFSAEETAKFYTASCSSYATLYHKDVIL